MNGQAFSLKMSDGLPLLSAITADLMYRDQALAIASETVRHDDWYGPRQIIFVHSDGFVELWDKELRE